MELMWKYESLFSIPFHSGTFPTPYQNFRSIPLSITFHSLPGPAHAFTQVTTVSLLALGALQLPFFLLIMCKLVDLISDICGVIGKTLGSFVAKDGETRDRIPWCHPL